MYIVWKQKKVARTAVALLQHNWPHAPLPHTQKRKWTELPGLEGRSLPGSFLCPQDSYLKKLTTYCHFLLSSNVM